MSLSILAQARRRWLCALTALALGLMLLAGGSAAATAQKNARAEEVVEQTINAYGSRAALYVIQHNGILRGLVKLMGPDGTREGKTVTKFIRKPRLADDLLMIEVELPDTKYTIGFDGKQTWSSYNSQTQEASPEMAKAFHAAHQHSYEALLRYKENNWKLEHVGRDKLGLTEIDIIDLIAENGARTRYYISRRTSHILYLEYEMKAAPEAEPVKYRIAFQNFKVIQNTLVPFETLAFENGRQIEERKLVEVAFNVQLDEKAFQSGLPAKPADTPPKP
jgi:hypothetical protein